MNPNNIETTFEVVQPLTDKEYIIISLTSILACEISDTINILRNIHFRYIKGKSNRENFSLQVWSAYLIYCKYMHIVDVEWLNMLESND